MRMMMVGINYRNAPVQLRERITLSEERAVELLSDIGERFADVESVVLSTCNRTELYLAYRSGHQPPVDKLSRLLASHTRVSANELAQVISKSEQEQAVSHLFRVASGIDSMVIGEPEILGQVKRAYERACETGSVGPALHHIFQKALAAARHARRATGIGQGQLSVASVAVDLASQIFNDFSSKTILSIGAGKMTKTMLGYLADLNPQNLWLVNRTLPSAQELWGQLDSNHDKSGGGSGGSWGVRSFDDLNELLPHADIVLTSTSSNDPIITPANFETAVKKRKGKPVFLIDIAVPRDVDCAIGDFENVYLYNIDDLQAVVAQNTSYRADEIERCQGHLKKSVEAAMTHISRQDVGNLARQLRNQLHELGAQELGRTTRKLSSTVTSQNGQTLAQDGESQIQNILDEHTRRLINKFLHMPLSKLGHRNNEPLDSYADALRQLFDLKQ